MTRLPALFPWVVLSLVALLQQIILTAPIAVGETPTEAMTISLQDVAMDPGSSVLLVVNLSNHLPSLRQFTFTTTASSSDISVSLANNTRLPDSIEVNGSSSHQLLVRILLDANPVNASEHLVVFSASDAANSSLVVTATLRVAVNAANLRPIGDLRVVPAVVLLFEPARLFFTVENDGSSDAEDVEVQLAFSDGKLSSFVVEGIPASSEVALSHSFYPDTINLSVTIVVDPANLVLESDESDNSLTSDLGIKPEVSVRVIALGEGILQADRNRVANFALNLQITNHGSSFRTITMKVTTTAPTSVEFPALPGASDLGFNLSSGDSLNTTVFFRLRTDASDGTYGYRVSLFDGEREIHRIEGDMLISSSNIFLQTLPMYIFLVIILAALIGLLRQPSDDSRSLVSSEEE